MNIVKISDGLGNQMFQYAFARNMYIETGKPVYLDTRFINNEDMIARKEDNYKWSKNGYRNYGLNRFRIKLPCADNNVLKFWKYLTSTGIAQHEIYKMAQNGLWPWKYCDEEFSEIDIRSNLPTYYKGYFFDLKYFDNIKATLQKEFVLKEKIHLPRELRNIIYNHETISLHVRRGDYIKLRWDISEREYYPKAVKFISQRVTSPVWLVFSDDIEWVKRHIKIDGKVIYISDMGFQDYEELMIMKHCKHNVIANSTFSYWAAYLNQNPDKIVVCPHNWMPKAIPCDWIDL